MTTATTKTRATTTTDMPDFAQNIREQLVSTVQQGQQLTVDAAERWVQAVSARPVADLSAVPGVLSVPGVEASTKYAFDVTADLLSTQRDFVQQLTKVLIPEKSA